MKTVVVVGGGVIGTMHALRALELGHRVVHIERDREPRQASVRNLGLIWVSGRAGGKELDLAVRARELWEGLGADVVRSVFRNQGSLTLLVHDDEVEVGKKAIATKDAARRGLELIEPKDACAINPALKNASFAAALYGSNDAIVEPRLLLPALRKACRNKGTYEWHPTHEVVGIGDHVVHSHQSFEADTIVFCPGASLGGPLREVFSDAPLERIRLQMIETAPFLPTITTSVSDADSLRYYPAYDETAMAPQAPSGARFEAQLLLVQRQHGGLTIGDTHGEFTPFDFESAAEEHLVKSACRFLGTLPQVVRRWHGVYARHNGPEVYYRSTPLPGVTVVTGMGGRGMTLSPAVAEETFK